MEDPGQKLRRIRERLNLRVRDVEQASLKIADKYHNDDFAVLINRISEIENRNLVPTIHKLYSCAPSIALIFKRFSNGTGSRWEAFPPTPLAWMCRKRICFLFIPIPLMVAFRARCYYLWRWIPASTSPHHLSYAHGSALG
jgi:transcriptional regulator with XRE-family HTH domain